jgi:two-component system OmpR family response regulator
MLAPSVLVVEDDAELRALLVRGLREEGFETGGVGTAAALLETIGSAVPDVLILDVTLPDGDGRDVCHALRAQGVTAPVLFLSAHGALTDRVTGLNAGADDYMTKPFAFAELVARLRALLRRSPLSPLQLGTMQLDPTSYVVHVGDRTISFTPTEFRLLAKLVMHSGETVRRRDLVETAWPHGARVRDNTLDTYLARIRRKLTGLAGAPHVLTVHGVGYRVDPPA